ncbi:MAG: polynucleotide adenylyltransferase PcnB [Betaproteobacteria bacterium]|nr:polynucleotide adenylyltransferase PcnB [Betaproteobacteria bacterium]
MIRKFIEKVFTRNRGRARPASSPEVIPVTRHRVARAQISSCARRVTETLQKHGYKAYVVGGAVRDLMLDRKPKDYDVATDATPEQVHALFRRSRIIGRRFRLVHVMCGPETVEVSTFRAMQAVGEGDHLKDEHGRMLRDNAFGSQAEDAMRRDFTVNALYYDPATEEVLDYCGGAHDVETRTLRIIGDARERYREDPVRMLRAVRLAAKLDLSIEAQTQEPIREMGSIMQHVPAARLFEEMLKLLLSGHSLECVKRLRSEGLHHGLLPMLDVILEQPLGERFVTLTLQRTDERILGDKGVSPGFLFAALLWHEVLAAWNAAKERGVPPVPALHQAMDDVLSVQAEKLAIPRRFGSDMKEIWQLQWRLEQRTGKRPYRVLESEKFRAGYDFLLLRGESGEVDNELCDWWTRFQHAPEAERAEMIASLGKGPAKRRRRRRGKREGSGNDGGADAPQPGPTDGD